MKIKSIFLVVLPVFLILFQSFAFAQVTAPSNLAATAISSSQINLSWTDNSTKPTQEDGFEIERAPTSTGTWTKIAEVGTDVRSYSNTGLNASTTYYYRVRSKKIKNKATTEYSAYSNTASATTPSGTTLPSAPSSLSATAASSSQINLSWADNSSNETGFKIDRATSSTGPWSQIATVGTNVKTYSNTGLPASTTYYYHVHAYNTAGDSAASNTDSATTQSGTAIPSAPSSLSATAASSSQINLSWADNSSNETGFKIDRATSSTGPWSQIATLGANVKTYSNTGLSASTTYYYHVHAYNTPGDSAASNTDNATTQSSVTIPTAPSSLSASAASSSQINLSWADNSSNETGFKIDRATSSTGPWSQIATVGANATSYQNTGLTASTTYYYHVHAYNTPGDSAASNTDSATTTPPSASGAHLWSMGIGNTGNDSGKIISIDGNGNILVGGQFAGTVDFGGTVMTSTSSADTFLAKYTSAGELLWCKRFGNASSSIIVRSIAIDNDNNNDIIITGYFAGSVGFGGATLTSAGSIDIFMAKYTATGTHVWSKRFGSTDDDVGYGITVDRTGNVVITGFFTGSVDFWGGGLASRNRGFWRF